MLPLHSVNRYLLISICALGLSACQSFREFDGAPSIEGAQETRIEALGNNRFDTATPVIEWWETLSDDQLSSLVEKALNNNKDIEIAGANLAEARAIARETEFNQLPTVRANAAASRLRSSGEIGAGPGQTTSSYEAGFDAGWELDLFGRVAQGVTASQAREAAAGASLRDVYVTVAAEVARTYIELRGAQYRLDIATRNADNQQESYKLTQKLESGGRSTALDIAQARTQFELTKSTIPSFTAVVTANIHRLSVLTGQVPDTLREDLKGVKALPGIPEVVNVGDISNLLRRRPDIQRAENNLAAAVAEYNVSVANQFPTVSLVGTLGFAATSLGSFGASAIAASAGPRLDWAAFDMGRVRAQIRQNDARAQASLFEYERTVLQALEELQTAISDFSKEEERRRILQDAARSSKEAAGLSRIRFEAGVDSFLNVLNAEASLLVSEDTLAQSEINTALDLIAVYKALGGGWQVRSIAE